MKNITIKQYTTSKQAVKYDMVLSNLKPKNDFAGHKMIIGSMPYANVKFAIRLLSKLNSWEVVAQLFEICFDVEQSVFWKTGVIEYYQARRFMMQEFQRIIDTESKVMASQSTDEHLWMMAGADRLKPYNDTLPLVQMGKLFGMYPFDIGRKPYNEVFALLAQIKVQGEVENEYQKLKTK